MRSGNRSDMMEKRSYKKLKNGQFEIGMYEKKTGVYTLDYLKQVRENTKNALRKIEEDIAECEKLEKEKKEE